MTTKGTDNRFRSLTVVGEPGTPSTPASGDFKLYVADDGTFYLMDDTGTTAPVGGGGFSDPMTTRGDIIVRNASNVTARLAVGSAGKVLSSDGTDVSWQTPTGGSGAEVWLQRQTASASAQLDFTSFISATYTVYKFVFTEIRPATDNVNFMARVGTGGGPSYDSASHYSQSAFRYSNTGSAIVGATAGSPATEWGLDGGGGIDNGLNSTVSGRFMLFNPSGTAGHRHINYEVGYVDNAGAPLSSRGDGKYVSTTAITAVRFLMSSGNITSGTIDVYGITHA